jgi:hypothetical protein
MHFAWCFLNVSINNQQGVVAVLTGYAYETIANKSLITGKTKGPNVPALLPATLGHLAAGSSAIPGWRRTNSVAAGD